MKKGKRLIAVAKFDDTNITEVIERNYYSSKAAFREDLKLNGFKVKFIASEADYDKVMEKVKYLGYMSTTQQEDIILEIFQ